MDNSEFQKGKSIIGKESQTIQIILKKNEKININKQYVLYASSQNLEEILYKDVDSLIQNNILFDKKDDNKKIEKINDNCLVRLKNKNINFEYIGLSKGGKIMKINPILYNNLYIRTDCVLCFDDGIDLINDDERQNKLNKIIFGGNRFIPNNFRNNIITGKNFMNSQNKNFALVKSKSDYDLLSEDIDNINILKLTSSFKDHLYLSGKSNLIEKRLGNNETMVLLFNSLVAFESSVTFSAIKYDNNNIGNNDNNMNNNINNKKDNLKYVNNLNDIIVEGPGLIIFEPSERFVPIIQQKRVFGLIIVSIILFILEIGTQLLLNINLRNN